MGLRKKFDPERKFEGEIILENDHMIELAIQSKYKYGGNKGISVSKGDRISFKANPSDYWIDLFRIVNANGFSNFALKYSKTKARIPEIKCFCLCGAIIGAKELLFPIGTERIVEIEQHGLLYFFANDHPKYYRNNFGSIKLSITKLSQ